MNRSDLTDFEWRVIENLLSKLKHFRRVATRYNRPAVNFLAKVQIAAMRLRLRA
jgi:transposase